MSTCVSSVGEYSTHTYGIEPYSCIHCGAFAQDAAVAEIAGRRRQIAAVREVCAQVEADDRTHLDLYGQHLPGSVIAVATMIRAALHRRTLTEGDTP